MVAVAFLLQACWSPDRVNFLTSPVEVGDVKDSVPAAGKVAVGELVEVGAASSTGTITSVNVSLNDQVAAGSILCVIHDPDLVQERTRAAAELAVALALAREARGKLAEAERRLRNRTALVERGLYSEASLSDFQGEVLQAHAGSDRAESEALAREASLRQAQIKERGLVIRAPASGTVIRIQAVVGEAVALSEEALFTILPSAATPYVEARVSERDVARITSSSIVRISPEGAGQSSLSGTVKAIGRFPIEEGRSTFYIVQVSLDERSERIFPGMGVSVEFVNSETRSVPRIPLRALYYTPPEYAYQPSGGLAAALKSHGLENNIEATNAAETGLLIAKGVRRVFVRSGSRWERREVAIGAQTDQFVEVRSGLRVGEAVIVGHVE